MPEMVNEGIGAPRPYDVKARQFWPKKGGGVLVKILLLSSQQQYIPGIILPGSSAGSGLLFTAHVAGSRSCP